MNNIKFKVPRQKWPKESARGNITRHSECGRYTKMEGGFNYETGKPGRERFYHATKGWRTRRGT